MCYNEFMSKTCQTLAGFLLILLTSLPAHAIKLNFPVACRIMTDCWITNHVDLKNNKPQREDYMCGQKLSNDNKSTHISLGSLNAIAENHAVVAAADGVVQVARDIGGFCGVRVLIEHDSGWETSYCHLSPDPILVREGQTVQRGQVIGAVGMSGQADWPRLSFAVIRNGMIFDPFSGKSNIEGCSAKSKPLWNAGYNPLYEPAHVTAIGFGVGAPNPRAIMQGIQNQESILEQVQVISLWAMMMNVMQGDEIHLQITAPSGRIEKENVINIDINREQMPIFMIANRGNLLWERGIYTGKITITRNVNGNEIKTGKVIKTVIHQTE